MRAIAIVALALVIAGGVARAEHRTLDLSRVSPRAIEFSSATKGVASFLYGCDEAGCWGVDGRTTDGGRTWAIEPRLRAVPTEWTIPVVFVTPNLAFTWEQTETTSRLLRSDDAGTTWVERPNPCAHLTVLEVSFASTARGWMLCGIGGLGTQGDQEQAIFETRDAAKTWRRIGGTPPILDGIELMPGVAWAWADLSGRELARIFVSGLGKAAWRHAGFDPAESEVMGIESFDAVSPDGAYALVRREHLRRYELRRTTDRGRSWTTVHTWSFAWAYRS